jgi:hypothetical protein
MIDRYSLVTKDRALRATLFSHNTKALLDLLCNPIILPFTQRHTKRPGLHVS